MIGEQSQNEKGDQSRPFFLTKTGRRVKLIFFDLIALNGGFIVSLFFRPDYVMSLGLLADHPAWIVLLNGLWCSFAYLFQIYNMETVGRWESTLLPIISVSLLTMGTFSVIPYLSPALPPSRLPLFVSLLSPAVSILTGRIFYIKAFGLTGIQKKVLIVGAGRSGQLICQVLRKHGKFGYDVVGFIDDDPQKCNQRIAIDQRKRHGNRAGFSSYQVLGTSDRLVQISLHNGVSLIVLAATNGMSGKLYQILNDVKQHDIEIMPMPLLYEQLTGRIPVEHVGEHWSLAMPAEHEGLHITRQVTKRLFDLLWTSVGMIFLVLIFPVLAAAIYLDSPGPIIYTQKRLGRHGKPFSMLKFRSMVPAAEKNGPVWAQKNDPRVTRVGRFLRRTHIDEFPQFINILKGEMSVVGPRPERPDIVKRLAEEIPFYRVRFAVKPGMAGWGLIHHGYGDSVADALIKLQYDLYYIKHQSLFLDIYILARTLWETLTLRGR